MEKVSYSVCREGTGSRSGGRRSFALQQAVCTCPTVKIALGRGWMWRHGVSVAGFQAARQRFG